MSGGEVSDMEARDTKPFVPILDRKCHVFAAFWTGQGLAESDSSSGIG
jgi:hypothetical protein